MRGRVYLLYMLLALASAVFLGICLVGPQDIASGRTKQKTPFVAVLLLLHDTTIGKDRRENTVPSGTFIGFVVWRDMFYCCVTVYCAIA
jgi:hypothetical protein